MTEYKHRDVTALVLAAGQGTRMNSPLPKVLHPMAGTSLLGHVIRTLTQLGVARTVVVVGHQHERVRGAFANARVEWAIQEPQHGTGHAVMMAERKLSGFKGTLLVVCGDTPLLRASTLHELLEGHAATGSAVTVLSMRLPDPTGYGRILREGPAEAGVPGRIVGIVEHRDATEEQLAIDEVNSGIYAFSYPALAEVLARLTAHNAQGEYYLTDAVGLLKDAGSRTSVVCCADYRELLGINTVSQLAEAERIYKELTATPEKSA